jgi:hypothetical protein
MRRSDMDSVVCLVFSLSRFDYFTFTRGSPVTNSIIIIHAFSSFVYIIK